MLLTLALTLAVGAPANAPADAGPAAVAKRPPPGVVQEAVLSRALFLVRRDACVLVEPDAPRVRAYDFDETGAIAPSRTEVARCEAASSLPAIARALSAALVLAARDGRPTAALPAFDVVALDDAAFALTGRRVVVSRTPAIDPDPAGQMLQSYDGAALRALFDLLYVKPGEQRVGIVMQQLYDATLREAVARVAVDVALLCARPKVLAAESKRVLDAARTGKGTTGKDSWRIALNKLVASDDDAARIDPRLVGFVLRRHGDGTLPIVRDVLRVVLTDYDPSAAAKLGGTL